MKKTLFGIAAAVLLPAWCLAAQSGAIQGSVLDSSGRPLVGALVTMSADTVYAVERNVFTDSRGAFAFANLQPGEYSVQAKMPQFAAPPKEKIKLTTGASATLRITLQTVAEVNRRAASPDAKQAQEIVWTLRSSRGTQSVLRFSDAYSQPVFRRVFPDYTGYVQFYSKGDPAARTALNGSMGSRFSFTLAVPGNAKATFSGQYNESRLEPKGASVLYEFSPLDGHQTQIGLNARQGIVLDDAFSSEELREFQVKYSDRFHLTETIIAEQGAEIGHAEGRATTNYFRPRLSLSWVPNDRTVFTAMASTQAPGHGDDPVRGREYFEQVNLPPSFEHYLHTEISASRFLDEATKVSAGFFQDRANYRALFVAAPDGRHGLMIFDGRSTPSQGVRLNLNREFLGFEAGFGYTLASGPALSRTASSIDEARNQMTQRRFQVVTARLKTDLEWTNTELTAVYRWIPRDAAGPIDPYQQTVEYNDPSLSISVAQNLPSPGNFPAKVQAILDARNLFEQSFGSSKTHLVHSPRFVKGGISIRF